MLWNYRSVLVYYALGLSIDVRRLIPCREPLELAKYAGRGEDGTPLKNAQAIVLSNINERIDTLRRVLKRFGSWKNSRKSLEFEAFSKHCFELYTVELSKSMSNSMVSMSIGLASSILRGGHPRGRFRFQIPYQNS